MMGNYIISALLTLLTVVLIFNFMVANYDLLPENLRQGIYLYIEKKIQPGSFLCAVLENNLTEAVVRCSTPLDELKTVIRFLIWEAPSECWGSKDKMNAWLIK